LTHWPAKNWPVVSDQAENKNNEKKVKTMNNENINKPALLDKACDITSFASPDHTRWVLQGIHYRPDCRIVEATDGKMAIQVPVSSMDPSEFPGSVDTEQAEDVIIPAKSAQSAFKAIPKTPLPAANSVKLTTNGKTFSLTTNDLDNEVARKAMPIDGKYPNIDLVMPQYDASDLEITLNAKLLKTVCEYALKHGQAIKGKDIGITFAFIPDNKDRKICFNPTTALIDIEPGRTAKVVLMPMKKD